MTITPTLGKLLIRPIAQEEKKGTLLMPDSAKKPSNIFEVIESNSALFSIGDKVIPMRHAGSQFEYNGEILTFIDEKEILATLSD